MYSIASFISTFAVLMYFLTQLKGFILCFSYQEYWSLNPLHTWCIHWLVGCFEFLATWFSIIISNTDQSIHLIPSVYTGKGSFGVRYQ